MILISQGALFRNFVPGKEAITRSRIHALALVGSGLQHLGFDTHKCLAADDTREEQWARYEALWQKGGFTFFLDGYNDIAMSEEANATLSDFIREKIREIVHDPETAEKLMPDYFVMAKRPILDNGYFETFNRCRRNGHARSTPPPRPHPENWAAELADARKGALAGKGC